MNVQPVDDHNVATFIAYCSEFGEQHDPSFVSEDELKVFDRHRSSELSFILQDGGGGCVGAISLMIEPYRKLNAGRLRIFHCQEPNPVYYGMLLDALLKQPSVKKLDSIYMFLPDGCDAESVVSSLSFQVSRYSWQLYRTTQNCSLPSFPNGFELRPLLFGQDEWAWIEVINESFTNLAGHTPCTEQSVQEMATLESFVSDGAQILWHGDLPVGACVVWKFKEQGQWYSEIGPLGIRPRYQGKGLGTALLRNAICFARTLGCSVCWLSVNAENQRAADLYLKEGFEKDALFVCWTKYGSSRNEYND